MFIILLSKFQAGLFLNKKFSLDIVHKKSKLISHCLELLLVWKIKYKDLNKMIVRYLITKTRRMQSMIALSFYMNKIL